MTRVENQNPPTLVDVTGPGTGRQGDRGRFDGPPSRLFERAAFVKLSVVAVSWAVGPTRIWLVHAP